ncbi:MAG: hypothetical protein H7Y89_17325, partial [Steroidobacteraceae bacterium]|nr:hypothetical protein [Steroidobacteraceae bacterium]
MVVSNANNLTSTPRPARRRLYVVAAFGGVLVACAAVVLFINLSRFDEPLDPALAALETSRPAFAPDNAYPAALEFLAADARNPHVAEIAGDIRKNFESLKCYARRYLDCAELLIAEVAGIDALQPRAAVLFERYDALVRHTHFVDTPERDAETRFPRYNAIRDVARLRLAISYRSESTPEFLIEAEEDLAFWKTVLREGDSLGTKMVALAHLQDTLDFLSTLLRERELHETEVTFLEQLVSPFSREESNISEAFLAEARTAVWSEIPPVAADASWLTKLLMQRNATLNQLYHEEIVLMQQRARVGANEFYEQGAHEPLRRELRLVPRTLYNFGGKLALSRSRWDAHEFPARVHDQNGRISLVLLQAEIERTPGADVAAVVRASKHRNPYTSEAMEYDPGAGVISFKCQHTAFHPPEPPDLCAVAVAPLGDKPVVRKYPVT